MSRTKKFGIEMNMDEIRFSNDTPKKNIIYDIVQIMLLYFATYSTLNCFSSGIGLPVDMKGINILIFFFCIISFVMVTYRKENKKVLIAMGGSFIAICILYREIIVDGMKAILTAYIALYDEYYWGNARYQSLTLDEIQIVILAIMIVFIVLLFVVYVKSMLKRKKKSYYSLLLMPFLFFYIYLALYDEYYWGGERYRSLTKDEVESAILAVMMVLSILLSVVYAKIIIKSQKSIYYSLISVPFVFCSFMVGMIPDFIPFLFYCTTSVVIFGSCTVKNSHRLKKQEEEKERTSSLIPIKQGIILLVMSCTFFVLTTIFFTEETYRKMNLTEKKQSLQMELKRISTAEVLEGTIFEAMWKDRGGLSKGGLSNGVIGDSKGVSFGNTTELKVKVDKEQKNGTIYLRGYIGQRYSQNQWNYLSKKSQKQLSDIKDQYSIEAIDSAISDILHLIPIWTGQQSEIGEISVQNVGEAKDYFYVPYHQKNDAFLDSNGFFQVPYCNAFESIFYTYEIPLKEESVYEEIKDQNETNIKLIEAWLGCPIEEYHTGHVSKEAKKRMDEIVAVRYLDNGRMKVDGICDDSHESQLYLLTELDGMYTYQDYIEDTIQIRNQFNFIKEYETFVYENYLQLPDDQLESVKALVDGWKQEILNGDNQSEDFYSSCILKIKDYFKNYTSYNLTPGAVPEGKEAVDYFLFENPNGYCMYYATAAVVMLREFGIPARYVEGFIVTQSDLAGGIYENGQIISNIKDSNAHAWIEVYKKGAGWVPIEVTPSYESNGMIDIPSENKDATLRMNPLMLPQDRPSATKAPTKAPLVSNKPKHQTSVQTGINNKENVEKTVINTPLLILFIMILLLFIAGILILVRIIINQRRKKMMNVENTSKKAILQYRVLQKILLNRKIVYRDKEPFTVYAKEIQKKFPCFTEEECQKYIYLILKARYHYGWLTKEEGEFTTLFYEKLIQEFYQNVSKYKRLYYRYVKFF